MSAQKLDPVNQIHLIILGLGLILVGISLIVGQAGFPSLDIPGAVVILGGFGVIGASFVRYPHIDKALSSAPVAPAVA